MNSKKKRNTSRKHENILNAAMLAFGELGYEKTSMDYIAEKAVSSKRTVYNHFPTKEVLFQAVIRQFAQEMHSIKQIEYDPSRSPEEQLADFADAEIALTQNPAWMGFMKVLLTRFIQEPEMAREANLKYGKGEDALAVWLEKAARDGKLNVENPALSAGVFHAMLGGAFTWPALYQGGLDYGQIQETKKELIDTFLSRYRK